MPKRIQLSRKKGWRMPPNTVKVDRSTRFGNPFGSGCQHLPGWREWAVTAFRDWLNRSPDVYIDEWARIRRCLDDIRGKNLACWCPMGEPCHADVLLEMANTTESKDGSDGRK